MSTQSAPNPASVRTLVSIHDVMPDTLPLVESILVELETLDVTTVTLLVVPGRDWTKHGIDQLKRMERQGCQLAAHGWQHHADRIGGLYHQAHAWLLSRRVAEHLALNADQILALMRRSRNWFIEHAISEPKLYVPPAWAMGCIARERIVAEGAFELYEVFGGILGATAASWQPTALLGYEADHWSRLPALRLWNHLNRRRALRLGWLRIGIHPFDFRYALAADLRSDLKRFSQFVDYHQLAGTTGDAG